MDLNLYYISYLHEILSTGIVPTSEYFLDQDYPSFNHRHRFDMTVPGQYSLTYLLEVHIPTKAHVPT